MLVSGWKYPSSYCAIQASTRACASSSDTRSVRRRTGRAPAVDPLVQVAGLGEDHVPLEVHDDLGLGHALDRAALEIEDPDLRLPRERVVPLPPELVLTGAEGI